MIISLEKIYSKFIMVREDGKKLGKLISDAWDKELKITVDFDNTLLATVGFFDEAFGKLAFQYPQTELQDKLLFENIDDFDKALLNKIIASRYYQVDVTK